MSPAQVKSKEVLPDAETAIAVARPLMIRYEGKEFVDGYSPLVAKRVSRFWVVTGNPENKTGEDIAWETYALILDAETCEVMAKGVFNNQGQLQANLLVLPRKDERAYGTTVDDFLDATAAWSEHLKLATKLKLSTMPSDYFVKVVWFRGYTKVSFAFDKQGKTLWWSYLVSDDGKVQRV